MATMIGSDVRMDSFAPEERVLASSSVLEGLTPEFLHLNNDPVGLRSSAPTPNPHFVFPAHPAPPSQPAPSQVERFQLRSSLDSPRPVLLTSEDSDGMRKPSDLPAFSFPTARPAFEGLGDSFPNPAQSPHSTRAIPSRPAGAGHRRGGSEFVGGSIRGGDSITVTGSSPTKSESGLASPHLDPSRPRIGHAHRRSAAISSHDLSSMILPSPSPSSAFATKGSSAPTSPAFGNMVEFKFPSDAIRPEQSLSATATCLEKDTNTTIHVTPPAGEQLLPKPMSRSRVGFSDTLEFIPRPVSLVSSDASSTATARPGHSVSGSISSVVSITNPATGEKGTHSVTKTAPSLNKGDPSRPSTAGAVLERTLSTMSTQDTNQATMSPRRNSIPHLSHIPPSTALSPSTPSPTKTPKRWSFFSLDPFVGSHSPAQGRSPTSSPGGSRGSRSDLEKPVPPGSCVQGPTDGNLGAPVQRSTSKKRTKKHKKVKTWAGSILSRKSKARHVKAKRRAPTPPPRNWESDDEALPRANCGMQTTTVMPTVLVTMASASEADGDWDSPQAVSARIEDDAPYPMIDLDAALGPFNTPLPRNPEWEAAQRAGGLVKKQLHSAAGMSRFTGPGMHYHRRAESAPEMVPFEGGRFGIHRLGSSSTMADVFEEDEEDDEDSDSNKATGQSTPALGNSTDKLDDPAEEPCGNPTQTSNAGDAGSDTFSTYLRNGLRRKGSDVSDDDRSLASSRVKSEYAGSSLHDEVIFEETDVPAVPAIDPKYVSGNDSSGTATPSPKHAYRPKDLAPVDVSPLQLPTWSLAPVSPRSMSQSSAFPSPRSPSSYDTQRISTAPSSVIEDNFRSLLMGEPGPEVRISIDDTPSLTSSRSTTTRESTLPPNPQARYPPLSNQPRPASFSATAFGRRRSSLASLNRLINSSHGERSKLAMEVPLDSETDRKPKVSKTKRLSRMVQFWKPKDHSQT